MEVEPQPVILQSTIERLLYILLFLMFLVNIFTLIKLWQDDNKKIKLICSIAQTVHISNDEIAKDCK